jgi:hypothetical protein
MMSNNVEGKCLIGHNECGYLAAVLAARPFRYARSTRLLPRFLDPAAQSPNILNEVWWLKRQYDLEKDSTMIL